LNWSSSSNWSTISGGASGAPVPTGSDAVVFDGASAFNAPCVMDVPVNVASLTISGYTGLIVQSASVNVSGGFTLASGNFDGVAAPVTLGAFSQNGGIFTSTSNTLTITGDANFASGIFNHNGGTINFKQSSALVSLAISGTPGLNNIIFSSVVSALPVSHTINNNLVANDITIDSPTSSSYVQLYVANSITARGKLSFAPGSGQYQLTGGRIYVEGDILLNSAVVNTNHATNAITIEMNGSGDQNLTSTVPAARNILPNIRINKLSGNLNLSGIITVSGPVWTYVQGTIVPGTATLYFYQPSGAPDITVEGTHTLGNVVVLLNYSYTGLTVANNLTVNDLTLDSSTGSKIVLSGTITVMNLLTLTGNGSNIVMNGGTIYAHGDINLNAGYTVLDAANTSTIEIAGAGAQKITGHTIQGRCVLPNITINKPSGILTLVNYITFQRDWKYIQGTVDASTNASCVYLNSTYGSGVNRTITTEGSSSTMSFHTLRLQNNYNSVILSGDLDVNGNLIIDGIGIAGHSQATTLNTTTANNYKINVAGHLSNSGKIASNNSAVTFDGLLNQDFTSIEPVVINNFVIDKASGNVNLLAPLSIKSAGQLTLTKGLIITSATTSPNYLKLNTGSITSLGSLSSYVEGPLLYEISVPANTSRTINLPVGAAGAWCPAELTVIQNSTALCTYKAELKNASASALGYTQPSTISDVSNKRYWQIDAGIPGNNFTSGVVKLYFDADDQVTDLPTLSVVKGYPATSSWIDISGGSKNGTGSPFLTGSIISTAYLPPSANSFAALFSLANLNNNPLPVSLASFTAEKKTDGVLLKWRTASELNNAYFSIERSMTGDTFTELDQVQGAGTVKTVREYHWLDKYPVAGHSYYRLRQVDLDRNFSFSQIVAIFSKSADENTFWIYPLPATDIIHFNTTSSVRIISASGNTMPPLENVDYVDVSAFSPGVYYLINQKGQAKRMIIVR
jgi:phage gp45-like